MIKAVLFGILLSPSIDQEDWEPWYKPMTTVALVYYSLLFLCYSILATGTAIDVFKRYKVNYTYIFEV